MAGERRLDVVGQARALSVAPLERCDSDERLYDYVLHRYEPPQPVAGKLRSVNLLMESFALAGVEAEGRAIMERLAGGLGRGRTVWGIKQRRGELLGWELYFYDYERHRADLSVAHLRELLTPWVTVDAFEPRALPWHMFSIEFSPSTLRNRAAVAAQIYVDMRSYELRGSALSLQNIYTFHDPKSGIEEVLHRLGSSLHFDARRHQLAQLLPPGLRRCHRVCVANKRNADALYSSRITTSALAAFCKEHQWPAALTGFVTAHAAELDHLLWDVGLDFVSRSGELVVEKTGLYGHY